MNIIAVLGDYYHNKIQLEEALSRVISKIDDVDITYTSRESLIDELKNSPDLVILASENRLIPNEENPKQWMSEPAEAAIINYVNKGGAWLAWHSGLANYESNSSYVKMVGGYFTHHPETQAHVQYQYNNDHGLSNGKESFKIIDEHYFINHDKDISIFLNSSSENGESLAGWTKSYGNGKVCAYIPAHNKDGLMDTSVQTDMKDIIQWLVNLN